MLDGAMKFSRLVASSIRGGHAVPLLSCVPKNVVVFALMWAPHMVLRPHVRVCASRPLKYVSVINDNHLVSLMNFITTKVN
jgi:hypothetical protein